MTNLHPIRIVLTDDHSLVRAGIRALLEDRLDVEIVAEARTGEEAVEAVRSHQPELVVMDIALPGISGLDAARLILKEFPETRVLFVSQYRDKEYVRQALRAGGMGYVSKAEAAEDLVSAVRTVMRGQPYTSRAIDYPISPGSRSDEPDESRSLDALSPRQREVFLGLAQGLSVKEMAVSLGISVKTVETHRAAIMDRLGFTSIAALVKHAIRLGLINPDS
jgi:DNA-binding NarL/FixJ family response regulator